MYVMFVLRFYGNYTTIILYMYSYTHKSDSCAYNIQIMGGSQNPDFCFRLGKSRFTSSMKY